MDEVEPDEVRRVIEACDLIPRNDSIIVYRTKVKKTAGGILVPDNQSKMAQGFVTTGIVVAVGPGRKIETTGKRMKINDLEPGDMILYSAMAGLEMGEVLRKEFGQGFAFEELRLIRDHDVTFKFRDRNVVRNPEKFKVEQTNHS